MNALKERRQREGITVEEMAKRLGVSKSCLMMAQRGERRIGRKLGRAISQSYRDLAPLVMADIMGEDEGKETDGMRISPVFLNLSTSVYITDIGTSQA